MQITAKVDYALRAMLTLAAEERALTAEALSEIQALPANYLAAIMNDLRRAGVLSSSRGGERGYSLARPAGEISTAEVMVAVEGPLIQVNGARPEDTVYSGAARNLRDIWILLGTRMSETLNVNLHDAILGLVPRKHNSTAARLNGRRSRQAQR